MHARYFKLACELFFALFCSTSAPALASLPTLDLATQIELGHAREGWAEKVPGKSLRELANSYVQLAPHCHRGRDRLIRTRAYLQGILERLVSASHLEKEMNSAYGVCVMPLPRSGGILSSLFDVPMLHEGVIHLPVVFMLRLKSEEELAFVIGHELSHFLLKHELFIRYLEATHKSDAFREEFTVRSEREADALGMRLIVNAGYDLNRALETIEILRARDELHPHADELEEMRAEVLSELQRRNVDYKPVTKTGYLTPEILSEIEDGVSARVSDASI